MLLLPTPLQLDNAKKILSDELTIYNLLLFKN